MALSCSRVSACLLVWLLAGKGGQSPVSPFFCGERIRGSARESKGRKGRDSARLWRAGACLPACQSACLPAYLPGPVPAPALPLPCTCPALLACLLLPPSPSRQKGEKDESASLPRPCHLPLLCLRPSFHLCLQQNHRKRGRESTGMTRRGRGANGIALLSPVCWLACLLASLSLALHKERKGKARRNGGANGIAVLSRPHLSCPPAPAQPLPLSPSLSTEIKIESEREKERAREGQGGQGQRMALS